MPTRVDAAPARRRWAEPYHAIKNALPQLAKGGAFALVIGLGGLGQIAVQILTALTGATVIATDMKEDAMRRAEANVAATVPGGDAQIAAIRELARGRGVDAASTSSEPPRRSRQHRPRWDKAAVSL